MVINRYNNTSTVSNIIDRSCRFKYQEGYHGIEEKGEKMTIKLVLDEDCNEFDILFFLENIIENWLHTCYTIKVSYRTFNYRVYHYKVLLTPE